MARPRTVPEEEALERALHVFWTEGYDRATTAQLGEAIGVGQSSLYNAFGSKAELYRKVLGHYIRSRTRFVQPIVDAVEERGARESVRELLRQAVRLYTSPANAPGCALLQSGGGDPGDAEGASIAHEFKQALLGPLRALFRGAARHEQLAGSVDTMARYLLGTMWGLSQLACDGASRAELDRVVEVAAAGCVL